MSTTSATRQSSRAGNIPEQTGPCAPATPGYASNLDAGLRPCAPLRTRLRCRLQGGKATLRPAGRVSAASARAGLSLPSLIVGVTIFMIMVTAVAALSITSLQSATSNRERVRAVYLAREGLELAKHVRDANRSAFATQFAANSELGNTDFTTPGAYTIGAGLQRGHMVTVQPLGIVPVAPLDATRLHQLGAVGGTGIVTSASVAPAATALPYWRTIEVAYLDPTTLADSATPTSVARVTARVWWARQALLGGGYGSYSVSTLFTAR